MLYSCCASSHVTLIVTVGDKLVGRGDSGHTTSSTLTLCDVTFIYDVICTYYLSDSTALDV